MLRIDSKPRNGSSKEFPFLIVTNYTFPYLQTKKPTTTLKQKKWPNAEVTNPTSRCSAVGKPRGKELTTWPSSAPSEANQKEPHYRFSHWSLPDSSPQWPGFSFREAPGAQPSERMPSTTQTRAGQSLLTAHLTQPQQQLVLWKTKTCLLNSYLLLQIQENSAVSLCFANRTCQGNQAFSKHIRIQFEFSKPWLCLSSKLEIKKKKKEQTQVTGRSSFQIPDEVEGQVSLHYNQKHQRQNVTRYVNKVRLRQRSVYIMVTSPAWPQGIVSTKLHYWK